MSDIFAHKTRLIQNGFQGSKQLLSNKIILAHILVETVDEFQGMNPKDAVPYIEGNPFISVVPVETGLTNTVTKKNGQRIVGLNTENSEIWHFK